MPIPSPAGPLTTVDEMLDLMRTRGAQALASDDACPVLLVEGQRQDWMERTELNLNSDGPRLPPVVIRVRAGRFNSQATRVTLGRSSVCDVIIPFAALSKVHAAITCEHGRYRLEDLGSSNGTFVEGRRLERNQPVPLFDGSVLSFGDVRATYRTSDGFHAFLARRSR